MNKTIYNRAFKRSNGMCEVCSSIRGLELHHIVHGSGKRQEHETIESVIILCYNCHRGTYGVHGKNGHELNLRLKIQLQERYRNSGFEEEEIRKLMGGKIYV